LKSDNSTLATDPDDHLSPHLKLHHVRGRYLPRPGSITPFRKAEQALKDAVAAYEEALLSDLTLRSSKDR
jgi:hypothetical protein